MFIFVSGKKTYFVNNHVDSTFIVSLNLGSNETTSIIFYPRNCIRKLIIVRRQNLIPMGYIY